MTGTFRFFQGERGLTFPRLGDTLSVQEQRKTTQFKEGKNMLLLTIDHVPGKKIQALGLVKGSVVQSKHVGNDFMAGMKTLVGGEIRS